MLAILWMALVFILSSSPDPPVPKLGDPTLDFLVRKLGHLTEYAIFAALLYRALRPRPSAFLLAFLIAILYAASDEWHQSFVAAREGTIRDWVIDSLGSVVALSGIALKRSRKSYFCGPR